MAERDELVGQEVDRRGGLDRWLDGGVVARQNRSDGQASEPGQVEDRLGDHHARDDQSKPDTDHRDDRHQDPVLEEHQIFHDRRGGVLEAQLIRREAVAASQAEYFEAIEGEFEYGLGTLPDLVDARLAHEQAQIDVISARFDWLRQKLELLRLTGRTPTAATGD